ncbi:MAG: hypothetical protein KF704_02465 [Crocinitomicaceae bacterium]|nr:hypothetical protein [Crocinitomicaceae bacterium]
MQTDHTTVKGTIGGTLLTLFATIDVQDYVKTIILASVGAIVSFAVSKFLKWCWDTFKRK